MPKMDINLEVREVLSPFFEKNTLLFVETQPKDCSKSSLPEGEILYPRFPKIPIGTIPLACVKCLSGTLFFCLFSFIQAPDKSSFFLKCHPFFCQDDFARSDGICN